MSSNQFYHIKSPHVITWIQQKLYGIGYLRSDCRLKVICDREGNETKRTLAFIHPSVYEELVRGHQRSDFQIEPFVIPQRFYPNPNRYTFNFCIHFPETWHHLFGRDGQCSERDQFYHAQIHTRIAAFISGAYTIDSPAISRSKSITKPLAFVVFAESVDRDRIACARYMIDQTAWDDGQPLRCYWAMISKKYRRGEEQEPLLLKQTDESSDG